MFDAQWLVDRMQDGIELIQSKIKDSKTSNKQIWYLLQAQHSLLRDYWEMSKSPSHAALSDLQGRVNAIEAQVKLLGAKGQLETVQFGKTRLGGAQ